MGIGLLRNGKLWSLLKKISPKPIFRKSRGIHLAVKFIGFFGFLSIPHILNKLGANPEIFRTWEQIAKEFWTNPGHHLFSLWTTFHLGVISIFISLAIGLFFGILFAFFDRWIGPFETVAKFIWSIPLIVVAVYLNIFLANTTLYIIITGVFLGYFPILSFTYKKAIEENEGIISLVSSFNLSKIAEFRFFRLREIFGNLAVPLAISVPLAYIGVTMGEFTVGRVAGSDDCGLGSDFQFAMQYSKFEKVYVAIILMVFLVFISGVIFDEIVKLKENRPNRR